MGFILKSEPDPSSKSQARVLHIFLKPDLGSKA